MKATDVEKGDSRPGNLIKFGLRLMLKSVFGGPRLIWADPYVQFTTCSQYTNHIIRDATETT